MANFFNSVRITNFKSLKDVTLSDCKRINLLIGKPNVGKSNILEAIGLFSLPYFKYNPDKKLTHFVRVESFVELFFDSNFQNDQICIETDNDECTARFYDEPGQSPFVRFKIRTDLNADNNEISIKLDNQLNLKSDNSYLPEDKEFAEIYFNEKGEGVKNRITGLDHDSADKRALESIDRQLSELMALRNDIVKEYYPNPKVKIYKFPHELQINNKIIERFYLIPPSGINLLDAIQENKIEKDLAKLFSAYGLNLLLDKTSNTLRIMKTLKDGNSMLSFPYSSIADTLQRIIFFKTAIGSNKNSILLFEEPEAHCFPPYIRQITQDIIDSETNQFFIATHSPYVLNDFLEYERNDVAIFIANFKNGETVIRRLTDEEVNDVYQYGIDLFFNHELFTDD